MNVHFSRDDRNAIDLALRQAGDGQSFVELPGAALCQRVGSIQRVLGLLAYLPAAEPPPGLVQRTLRRVQGGISGRATAQARIASLTAGAVALQAQTFRRREAKYPPS